VDSQGRPGDLATPAVASPANWHYGTGWVAATRQRRSSGPTGKFRSRPEPIRAELAESVRTVYTTRPAGPAHSRADHKSEMATGDHAVYALRQPSQVLAVWSRNKSSSDDETVTSLDSLTPASMVSRLQVQRPPASLLSSQR